MPITRCPASYNHNFQGPLNQGFSLFVLKSQVSASQVLVTYHDTGLRCTTLPDHCPTPTATPRQLPATPRHAQPLSLAAAAYAAGGNLLSSAASVGNAAVIQITIAVLSQATSGTSDNILWSSVRLYSSILFVTILPSCFLDILLFIYFLGYFQMVTVSLFKLYYFVMYFLSLIINYVCFPSLYLEPSAFCSEIRHSVPRRRNAIR